MRKALMLIIITLFILPILTQKSVIVTEMSRPVFVTADGWNVIQITSEMDDQYDPVIAVDKNNVAHIAWVSDASLFYTNSKSGWEKVAIASGCVWPSPSIAYDNDIVYVAWADDRNARYSGHSMIDVDIYYAKSSDGWIHHLVTDDTNQRCEKPQIVIDTTGNIHIVYERDTTEYYPCGSKIFHVDQNSDWSEHQVSDYPWPEVGSGVKGSTLGVDSKGVAHVAYYTGDQIDHIRYANSQIDWKNVQIDSDPTNKWWDDRVDPRIIVDSNDVVHVAWVDHRNTIVEPGYAQPNCVEIYYANSGDGWANREIALPDTEEPEMKSSPALAVDAYGVVHAVWLHLVYTTQQMNVYYSNSKDWNFAQDITNFPDEPIERDPEVGPEPAVYVDISQQALAVDNNGVVHVTWRDDRAGDYNIYYAFKPNLEITPSLSA